MLISLTSPNIETICEKEPVGALFRCGEVDLLVDRRGFEVVS